MAMEVGGISAGMGVGLAGGVSRVRKWRSTLERSVFRESNRGD